MPTSIEIDDDVFAFLQSRARPWVDTPNDVLRRLLLGESAGRQATSNEERGDMPAAIMAQADPDVFIRALLSAEFGAGLRRRPPYRMMFESEQVLVYCQNFNKAASHLWYRITENPWRELRAARKAAWICFTNPAERFAYVVPVSEIKQQVERRNWRRPFLEVNIDPATSRWTELNWDLSKFRKAY